MRMNRVLGVAFAVLLMLGAAEPAFAAVKIAGSAQDKADFLKELNESAGGAAVTLDASDNLQIGPGGNKFAARVRTMVDDASTAITIEVGRDIGSPEVTIGRYNNGGDPNQYIDLADKDQLTTDTASGDWSQAAVIIHEMWEAYYSKKNGVGYGIAHPESIDVENEISTDTAGGGSRRKSSAADPVKVSMNRPTFGKARVYVPWTKNGVQGYMVLVITPPSTLSGKPSFVPSVPAGETSATQYDTGGLLPSHQNGDIGIEFTKGETIYLSAGTLLADGHTVPIYVIPETYLADGMPIPARVPGTALSALVDPSGGLLMAPVWNDAQPGTYTIVIDTDMDGRITYESSDAFIQGVTVSEATTTPAGGATSIAALVLCGIALLAWKRFEPRARVAEDRGA
jgi:hypothetical protein